MKDKSIAYILWAACFMGICGLQRLYLGKIGTGLLYLFTFGLLGIGQLVDLFTIPAMVREANDRILADFARGHVLAGVGGGLLLGRAKPRTTEEFQVALTVAAEAAGGKLTIAEAVRATGRSFKDVKAELDRMVVEGYIELDSDDNGEIFYRFPGLDA
ncbi:MAG TPA: TM2 domain-containing protein [Gemmatimonadales bacterium]|nr:TM2 domain-containing protein [Gemmatimonadales bacterium]